MSKQKELTQFEKDLSIPLMINNVKSSRGFYNLIVSRRDFKLFQMGMVPQRGWKFTITKKYFGIKGDREKAVQAIEELYNRYKAGDFKELEIS